jgi:uncharacterized membrane protein
MERGEAWLGSVVQWLILLVEGAAALIIFAGAVLAFGRSIEALVTRSKADPFVRIRLTLGRFLVLGLEFQLASDLLRTAMAPSFEQIGKLAAVAAIRTALNFFLEREIRRERQEVREGSSSRPRSGEDREDEARIH